MEKEMMKAARTFDEAEVALSADDKKRLEELITQRKRYTVRSDQKAIDEIDAEIAELRANNRR